MKDVHKLARFCFRLKDSPNAGFMVHQNSESSLVVVKSMQYLVQPLMESKESVLGKLNNSLFFGGMVS